MKNREALSHAGATLALALLWTLSPIQGRLAAQEANIVPVRGLGPGGFYVSPMALNNRGEFAGWSYTADYSAVHAFLYTGGSYIDLTTLGGTYSAGIALNGIGEVAGESSIGSDIHAFLYAGGRIQEVTAFGGTFSTAVAINDLGMVAGDASLKNSSAVHAFLFAGGAATDLQTLGGTESSAVDLNELGQVAGNSTLAGNRQTHAFFYDGAIHDLGTLGGLSSLATGLNNVGHVVGESKTLLGKSHAFVYRDGSMQDLGTLGGDYSTAYAINEAGQIAGDSITSQNQFHAFLVSNGQMLDLQTLGGNYSTAYALNSSGHVVGDSATVLGRSHAFLWRDGGMIDLNSLLPPDSGWELFSAQFINDAGQIIGLGYFGEFQWFLFTPNQPPVADAGSDQNVECAGVQTAVTLDGTASTDPENENLSYEWSEGETVLGTGSTVVVHLTPGLHTIKLVVKDPHESSAEDSVSVNIVGDTQPPAITCPAPSQISADENCQAVLPDLRGGLQANDNCSSADELILGQSPAPGTLLGPGDHIVILSVEDKAGNRSTCEALVTVRDTTAPVFHMLTVTPSQLSPPNRQMVSVAIAAEVTDNCDASPVTRLISITSSEPVVDQGDKTTPDWIITGPLTAELRAETGSKAEPRVYTLTVQSTDASRNSATQQLLVTVQKQKK